MFLMSLSNLCEEVNAAAREMQSYRPGKHFTELEKALSLFCFATFLYNVEKNSSFANQVNEFGSMMARQSAIIVTESELIHKEHVVKRYIPSYNINNELEWCKSNVENDKWKFCTTRALILITRELVYRYTGTASEYSVGLNSYSYNQVMQTSKTWLSSIDSEFFPQENVLSKFFRKWL